MATEGFPDLRSYLELLRSRGRLTVVDAPVDAELEVPEIHRRVIAAGGPALLFNNVRGSSFRLATNLFGSPERARWAFGERPRRFIERLAGIVHEGRPPSPGMLWQSRDLIRQAASIGLRRRRRGAVTEVISSDVRLDRLPILKTWPEDGGRFVTLPLVYTEHPESGGGNLGMYRLHVHDERTTGMHWQIGKGGGFHYQVAEAAGQPLPATVFLGGPPALILSAIAPLPENAPELLLASLIAGRKLRLCEGPGAHPLVADCEFALIGKVPPASRRAEGPFGDHYGYYSLEHDYPCFEIDHIAHRADAIYPATVVGKPRQEDFFIGDLLQELLSPLFPLVMPGVLDIWSYGETGYHSLAAAVVRERYRREAMASAFRILGEGQLSLTKFLLVTDRRVDLRDFRATLEHVLARARFETDLYVLANLSMDTLDYTAPTINEGSKGVLLGLGDPLRTLPAEFSWPDALPPGVDEVHVFCPGCLVVGARPREEDAEAPQRIAEHAAFAEWPLVVVTEEPRRVAASSMNFLWATFTRFEPAADIHAATTRVVRHHPSYSPPIVIDARLQPGFPDELFCDPATAERVDTRWKEYFPEGQEMGDSGLAHLDRPGSDG